MTTVVDISIFYADMTYSMLWISGLYFNNCYYDAVVALTCGESVLGSVTDTTPNMGGGRDGGDILYSFEFESTVDSFTMTTCDEDTSADFDMYLSIYAIDGAFAGNLVSLGHSEQATAKSCERTFIFGAFDQKTPFKTHVSSR